jgi:hypothetical protein
MKKTFILIAILFMVTLTHAQTLMNSSRSTVGYYEGVRGTYAALFFFYFFD